MAGCNPVVYDLGGSSPSLPSCRRKENMKLEEKKILAEWMGWEVDPLFPDDEFWRPEIKNKSGKVIYYFHDWNPDTNHEQFKEVWNKLPTHLGISLIRRFGVEENPQKYGDIILNNLPELMDEIIEVLKEESKVLQK